MTDKAREIVKRLRDVWLGEELGNSAADIIQSQSARIAELEARVKELEKALLDAMVQINQLTGQYDTKQENTK